MKRFYNITLYLLKTLTHFSFYLFLSPACATHTSAHSTSDSHPPTHLNADASPHFYPNHHTDVTPNPDPATWTKEEVLANHEKERLAYLEEQGPAQSIPALEYHGDNYRQ